MTQDQLTREDTRVCIGTNQQFSYINLQNAAFARSTRQLEISNLESFTVLSEKVFYFCDVVQSI